jgi:hypothetical protein
VGRRAVRPGTEIPSGAEQGAAALSTPPPSWAQPGITDVAAARTFLAALAAEDTLVLGFNDTVAIARTPTQQRVRGHGITIAANIVAATPPPAELVAYHRSFGLGPTRVFCPRADGAPMSLTEHVLADAELVARLRADASLRRMLFSFKNPHAERLVDALGLTSVLNDPTPDAYARANDKLALARAGASFGFATLPAEPIPDEATITARFPEIAARYGEGCIVRTRRGAGGSGIRYAPTLRAARRAFADLVQGRGEVLLVPYVPAARIRRNVATHGLVTREGFAPFFFTDQILHGHDYAGGTTVAAWPAADRAAIHAGLAGVARWFRHVGYCGAPAGVDGFLMDGPDGPEFVVLDPNARLSATTQPWAAVATLTDAITRPMTWRFEEMHLIGRPFSLARLRRELGADLLTPGKVEHGGILPTFLFAARFGPIGSCYLWTMMLGHDADHVAHLRRRVRSLGITLRRDCAS